ncbi:hypothetical protein OG709_20305 [Streptomyces sp. NBC_01267]|uniref:hypothetical protein n=1 Tax=unclassified Streptomyces TaxID=2593676 RepID=UPI002025548F|nr:MULTISPECIES: hypothetical protein [unclassified Streptomyces]MCX4549146.1 hypothetical protein [Streptomyces sp. NBC_01500]WSC20721.1 hypothetical protein OIE60_14050 [Streptomyces sp. NBC_01766]WSV54748.1 hypothetical protein OG282_14095 [Streptomyces sp. NBC_01014]
MPRGRHRHSPPLHRLLQPSAVAGASLLLAAGAWLFADPLVLRCLVAGAAAAAVTGAFLMRSWDRVAGRRVAELTRARAGDEWKAEERAAELEGDLEESRALRVKLEAKLRSKRIELAGLRGEHAALLRRYANAETERASALEGRRLLAIEAAAPARAALPAANSTPTPAAYTSAVRALDALTRNAAAQQAQRDRQARQDRAEAVEPEGKHSAAVSEHTDPPSALPAPRHVPASQNLPAPRNVPATAVAPYTPQQGRANRPVGRFDFFGMQKVPAALEPAQLESVQNEDLADVVGAEAIEAHEAEAGRGGDEERGIGQVIDLTAHDETEQLDLTGLRSAIS